VRFPSILFGFQNAEVRSYERVVVEVHEKTWDSAFSGRRITAEERRRD